MLLVLPVVLTVRGKESFLFFIVDLHGVFAFFIAVTILGSDCESDSVHWPSGLGSNVNITLKMFYGHSRRTHAYKKKNIVMKL